MPTIIVPTGKCPLNILANLGVATKNARILFDYTVEQELLKTADKVVIGDSVEYYWNATDKYSKTSLKVDGSTTECGRYSKVLEIDSERISFKHDPEAPKFTIYLMME